MKLYYWDDQVRENEMGMAFSTHGREK